MMIAFQRPCDFHHTVCSTFHKQLRRVRILPGGMRADIARVAPVAPAPKFIGGDLGIRLPGTMARVVIGHGAVRQK